MVGVDTSFKELKRLVSKDLSLKELESVLFDMGMELDDVQGDNIRIEVTPDRPDMVSAHGLARALKAYMGLSKGMPKYAVNKAGYKVIVDSSVKQVRPFTVAAVIKNLEFDDQKIREIIWVQEKLHQTFARQRKKGAIGIYPMEEIVFPIHYFAKEPDKVSFVPLESSREMTAAEILKQHPTGKEYAHLLEGKKKFPFFRDAKGDILSMPPVINSHKTGKVTVKTKEVFIECSGDDLNALNILLNILVTMFADMGGEIYSVEISDAKKRTTPDLGSEKRRVSVDEINRQIGTSLNAKECKSLLERMMYDVVVAGNRLDVSIPAFRSDIWHNVDLIDDAARAFGFNKLKPTLTPAPTVGGTLEFTDFEETVCDLLAGLGLNEVFTLALTSTQDQFVKMNLPQGPHMRLGAAAEKTLNMVRCSLLPELLKVLVSNRSRQFPQKIFEAGDVVVPDKSRDVLSRNVKRLSVVLSSSDVTFTEIKQVLNEVASALGVAYTLEKASSPSFIAGRCGNILVGKKVVGVIGEVHPQVISNWELSMPVAAFEIDLAELFATFKKV